MRRLKSKGHTLSNQIGSSFNFNSIFLLKNLFGEFEDHTLIGSKLSKQEVQSTRTNI